MRKCNITGCDHLATHKVEIHISAGYGTPAKGEMGLYACDQHATKEFLPRFIDESWDRIDKALALAGKAKVSRDDSFLRWVKL